MPISWTPLSNHESDPNRARLIRPEKALKLAGMSLEEVALDVIAPPCCSLCAAEGSMVEPDGTCSHGYPSVLRSLGWI